MSYFLLLASFFLFPVTQRQKKNILDNSDMKIQYMTYSRKISGDSEYNFIYNNAFDSISNWANHGLKSYLNERDNEWFLDSLVCFNLDMDKCIMAIAKLNTKYPKIEADGLTYFYGVKIGHKWYFFDGPYLAIPRGFYRKNTGEPLSEEILKSIAMEEIFKGYLKKNGGNGKWEINDAFFTGFAPKNQAASGYGSCFACKTEEEYYLYLVNQNWEDRDTTE